MNWLEKLSVNIFKSVFRGPLALFSGKSPEVMLRSALDLLDDETVARLKRGVAGSAHPSGGFTDRAGQPDLYYTLFGTFLTEALELSELQGPIRQYVENTLCDDSPLRDHNMEGIHLYCASILVSKLSLNENLRKELRRRIRKNLSRPSSKQPVYTAFVTLLACYYSGDTMGILRIRRQLQNIARKEAQPSPVIAALMVLRHTFHGKTADLVRQVREYYDGAGGFRALKSAPVADLLSTAVVLYALRYVGEDLRLIKPDCLRFMDALYHEGGFAANALDPDTDVEYTFYGLLALGSLT